MTEDDSHQRLRQAFADSWTATVGMHLLYINARMSLFGVLCLMNALMLPMEIMDTSWLSWVTLILSSSSAAFTGLLFWLLWKKLKKIKEYQKQLRPMLSVWLAEGEGVTSNQWDSMLEQLESSSRELTKK